MASLLGYLNRLLPFATPGTPLVQDLLHLTAICGALYFAPQVQEWYQRRDTQQDAPNREVPAQGEEPEAQDEDVPRLHIDYGAGNPAVRAETHPQNEEDHVQPEQQANAQQEPEEEIDDGQPGPAQNARVPDLPAARNVGAKKAKALAKKDQRRAYHEFQRSQGEAQRARDAEGAAEREAELAAERDRRREAAERVREKEAREREVKRESERKAREDEIRKREKVVEMVKEDLIRRLCLW